MSTLSIPLTQGKTALIDAEDYPLVSRHKWCAVKINNVWYASSGTAPRTFLHRFLVNPEPRNLVDHHNGDGLDNRRSNLRECTKSQNSSNHLRIQSNNTIGFIGVSFHTDHRRGSVPAKPYRAGIGIDGKWIRLGYFATAEEAARARDVAAIEHHGEFASLNFPRSD